MRAVRSILAGFGLAVAFAGGSLAHAASLVGRSVEYMTVHADAVVQGVVVAQSVALDAAGQPWTRTELAVDVAWKGASDEVLSVWQQGGALADGSIVRIDGDLDLAVGERAVLFLARDPEHGGRFVSFLLGWSAFEITGEGPLASLERSDPTLRPWALSPEGALLPPGTKGTGPKPPILLTQLVARIERTLEVSK